MRRIIGMLCACLVWAGGVSAAEIPQYNVEESCKEIANGSNLMELSCRKVEMAAYKRLQEKEIPSDILSHCDEIAAFGGTGTYSLLESCVKQELRAKRELGK